VARPAPGRRRGHDGIGRAVAAQVAYSSVSRSSIWSTPTMLLWTSTPSSTRCSSPASRDRQTGSGWKVPRGAAARSKETTRACSLGATGAASQARGPTWSCAGGLLARGGESQVQADAIWRVLRWVYPRCLRNGGPSAAGAVDPPRRTRTFSRANRRSRCRQLWEIAWSLPPSGSCLALRHDPVRRSSHSRRAGLSDQRGRPLAPFGGEGLGTCRRSSLCQQRRGGTARRARTPHGTPHWALRDTGLTVIVGMPGG
jgi:hypothetical protein